MGAQFGRLVDDEADAEAGEVLRRCMQVGALAAQDHAAVGVGETGRRQAGEKLGVVCGRVEPEFQLPR